MSDLPGYLIIITSLDGKLDVFSAHHTDNEAKIMHDRLSAILGGGITAHLVEVPTCEGVVSASEKPVRPAKTVTAPEQPAEAPQPPAPPPAPFRRLSAEQFEEETRNMLENGVMTFRDADAPFGEGGAFS
jgi:hypothetical protein